MNCTKCNALVDSSSKFCSNCGSLIVDKAPHCKGCQNILNNGARFCDNCGLEDEGYYQRADKQERSYHHNTTNEGPYGMSLWGYFVKCLNNYAVFDGRARRAEYWGFYLYYFVFTFAGSFLFGLGVLFAIATLIPYLAVLVRRLHDTGRGWEYALWLLLPIVGTIIIIILTCEEGNRGTNQYGADPKCRD
jgi:uncharacterized membrane protein YhaH (DUF805 family)/RNA polymerase subunit RPABC4/transcription elongation factor Spt4